MLSITYVPISKITEYGKNSRTHSPEQIEQIAESIKQFGFTNPVLIDKESVLIAGHGRLAAARKLGLESVPAIVLKDISEAKAKALRIADNKIALNSSWNEDMLRQELADLKLADFDLNMTGFGNAELSLILAEEPEAAAPGAKSKKMNFVVSYNIVFDDKDQQDAWFAFVRWLKANYTSSDTLGGRIADFVKEKRFVAD